MVAALAVMTVVLLFYPGSGIDERMYHEATARWLAGGPWYLPHQLAGPYVVAMGDVLYPPVMLFLFVPFQWLPAQLWYAIPLAVTAWGLWRFRPAWWAWLAIAAIVAWPPTIGYFMFGNPKMWLVVLVWLILAGRRPCPSDHAETAEVARMLAAGPVSDRGSATGTRHLVEDERAGLLLRHRGAPSIRDGRRHLLLIPHARILLVATALVALSIPFGSLNADYLAAVLNARGVGYMAPTIPLLAIPVIAWLGRVRVDVTSRDDMTPDAAARSCHSARKGSPAARVARALTA